MTPRLRHQVTIEDEVFITFGPGVSARVPAAEAKRFALAVLQDLSDNVPRPHAKQAEASKRRSAILRRLAASPCGAADLCAVRLDEWLLQPCFDPASHLVYVAGREQVSHTWVEGKLVMKDGVPLQIDISELLDITGLWHTRLTS